MVNNKQMTLKSLIVKFENFKQSRLTVFLVAKCLFYMVTAVLKIVSIFVVRSNYAIFCSINLVAYLLGLLRLFVLFILCVLN